MVQDSDQEVFVELEGVRELFCHLPDTVYELKEDGCPLVIPVVLISVANTLHVHENPSPLTLTLPTN